MIGKTLISGTLVLIIVICITQALIPIPTYAATMVPLCHNKEKPPKHDPPKPDPPPKRDPNPPKEDRTIQKLTTVASCNCTTSVVTSTTNITTVSTTVYTTTLP